MELCKAIIIKDAQFNISSLMLLPLDICIGSTRIKKRYAQFVTAAIVPPFAVDL